MTDGEIINLNLGTQNKMRILPQGSEVIFVKEKISIANYSQASLTFSLFFELDRMALVLKGLILVGSMLETSANFCNLMLVFIDLEFISIKTVLNILF